MSDEYLAAANIDQEPVLASRSDSINESNQGGSLGRDGSPQLRANQPLYNGRPPKWLYQRERWGHREMAFLAAMGYGVAEIAERTQHKESTVSNILRQPWIVELIAQEQALEARKGIRAVLNEDKAIECCEKLSTLMETANSQEVQRKAANDLLNRIYGMPNQSVTHTQKKDLNNLTDEELAKIVANGREN